MDTNIRTPMEIFNLPHHLVVPLFQRPYVWDETEQWAPLWADVRRMAELRLNDPFRTAAHFLGAVVLQVQETSVGSVPARNVIDGQQRLTTLQLLMDAAAAVFEEAGQDHLASQMETLTHNSASFVQDESDRLKIRHTNRDRAAFEEVMRADPPIDHERLTHATSRLASAHRYFMSEVQMWLGPGPVDAPEFAQRAQALAHVLQQGLQIVVIDLQVNENSQEIFETLNARGTPLTAADLIKNFVFQKLESDGADTAKVYAEDWPFESKFWEKELAVGRVTYTRGALFLNQWLVARVAEEIPTKSTFTRFKHFVEHESKQKMIDLLRAIKAQAEQYEAWTTAAADPDRNLTVTEMNVYRMQANGIELLKPVLLWLYEPGRYLPQPVIDRVIGVVESWVVRRSLLRLTTSNLGAVVANLIRTARAAGPEDLGETVEHFLRGQKVASSYWPGDAEIRAYLSTAPAYRRYPRARLRMVLEAVEDHLRAEYHAHQVDRRGYPIEHLLPQKWESHWSVDGEVALAERAAHVHRLGNLTLLTATLNSAVSNGRWLGRNGKYAKLAQHDVLKLNQRLREASADGWDEARIGERTADITEIVLRTWPVPAGHTGEITDSRTSVQSWVEVNDLVTAGLLAPGTVLKARTGSWADALAAVTPSGALDVGGAVFNSPSAAGKHVKGSVTNGWTFWRLEDGRTLADVRAVFRGEKPGPDAKAGELAWWDVETNVEEATEFWAALSTPARRFFSALIEASPDPVGIPKLAERAGVVSDGKVVAGVLAWPGRFAARTGHYLPSRWIQGPPVQYWMDEATAETFTEAIRRFDASQVSQTATDLPDDWRDLHALATDEERAVLVRIAAMGLPRPEIGGEGADGIPVPIGWPARKVAAEFEISAETSAELGAGGWRVVPVGEELRAVLA
ncbi:uncharacterized protein DUF4357 [Promicromonospora sp. AC04]|uniref:GmrSD restriction endonuclease domain-containing protein n=1 Tax=Promicromonospora sp. AC04 TaxID=2135723 RepID=UPI000D390723|nr:DUF262 domain-containing protein [Promicromonospora sp. AC04]PUB19873.1 uncharacterized protein DUF4357 [Promicromonospora sp. AC04]